MKCIAPSYITHHVSTTSARLSLHTTRTVRACILLRVLSSITAGLLSNVFTLSYVWQWYTRAFFDYVDIVLRLHGCWLLSTLACKLFPPASASCYFSYFLIPPLCFHSASSSSYFVILLRFPVLLPFPLKKIHNLSRIMERILTRIFVKTGLNMSSTDKGARAKGRMCHGCLPTPSIYAFMWLSQKRYVISLRSMNRLVFFAGDRDNECLVAVR